MRKRIGFADCYIVGQLEPRLARERAQAECNSASQRKCPYGGRPLWLSQSLSSAGAIQLV